MALHDKNRKILERIIYYCDKLDAAQKRFGRSLDALRDDYDYFSACSNYFIQIGELSSHLTSDFRDKHTGIPWRLVKDMRNWFAHDYENINYEETWRTLQEDMPALKAYCQKILRTEYDG